MTQEKKYLYGWVILVVSLLLLVVSFLIFRNYRKNSKKEEPDQNPEHNQDHKKFTYQSFRDIVLKYFPSQRIASFITAHAAHESKIFTSAIFVENNNPFGMRQPEVRNTLSTGSQNGYAVFDTIDDSINDLKLWFDYNGIVFTEDMDLKGYVHALKEHNYFESDFLPYFNAVNRHYKKINNGAAI